MTLTLRNSFPVENGTEIVRLDLPTGTSSGDLLLLHVVTANNVVTTPPGGFQLVAEIVDTVRTSVFQKIAASDEPSAYWVRWETGVGTAALLAIDASATNYPVVHQMATASSNSASANKGWAGVTNTDANTLLLCFGGFGSNAASTPDAAMTERYDTQSPRAYLMTQAVVATGATGTRTATGSSVASQRCITLSISEAASPAITYPPEVAVTSEPVLVEMEGAGLYVTQTAVLVEIGAAGIYLSALPVLVEVELAVIDKYAVGDGHDLPVSFLTKLNPQPHCKGVRIMRRDPSHSGEAHQDDAQYIVYEYNIVGSIMQYRTILDQFGLLEAMENEVTVTARDKTRTWQRWNGTAVRPRINEDIRRDNFFPRDIAIFVKDVELAQ